MPSTFAKTRRPAVLRTGIAWRRIAAFALIGATIAVPAAAQNAPAGTQGDIEEAAVALFLPYLDEASHVPAVWERPVFTRATQALITRWKQVVPQSQPGLLDGGDWLCQCRTWDPVGFRAEILTIREAPQDAIVEIAVRGGGSGAAGPQGAGADAALNDTTSVTAAGRTAKLHFWRENGAWRLDDVVSEGFPRGIKQELQGEIARASRR